MSAMCGAAACCSELSSSRTSPSNAAYNALAERVYYRCLQDGPELQDQRRQRAYALAPLVIARSDLDRALDIVEDAVLAG